MKIFCTSLFQNSKQWTFRLRQPQSTKEWEKLETLPAWHVTKVKSKKKRSVEKGTKKRRTVNFATLMDSCHLKKTGKNFLWYKGHVVLQGDVVEDDSRSYAVFTEQGSSASQMTARTEC